MFHFRRSTLWIIIYITIPLVAILHAVGPKEPDKAEKQGDFIEQWSLDELKMQCENQYCILPLEDTQTVYISAILDRVPVSSVPVPEGMALNVTQQGGQFVLTLSMSDSKKQLRILDAFLTDFIPESAQPAWVTTGAQDFIDAQRLTKITKRSVGESIANNINAKSSLTRLVSPPFGTSEQLAFLLWIEVLKQRLAGYDIRIQWDHRAATSYVLINTTLSSELFGSVSNEEFQAVLEAYQQAAGKRERTASQLHRYAVTASVYDLSFDYFVNQPQRLNMVQLADIEDMRAYSFEQIRKKN